MRGSASSILTECRDLSTERVAEVAAQLMGWVPGKLAERAQKEVESDQKTVFLRARDEARGRGLEVAEEFRRGVAGAFDRLVSRSATRIDPATPKKLSVHELTLVDHEDLSETIKVRDLIRLLTAKAGEEIALLQPRLAMLASVPELSDGDDPLSPHTLCNSFRAACEKFDRDVRVRMVVLDAFQSEGIVKLEELYRDLNALLLKREVLPASSFRVQKGTAPPTGGGNGARTGGGNSSGAASPSMPDLFALLQGLVAQNTVRASVPSGMPPYAPPSGVASEGAGFGGFPQINFDLSAGMPEPIDSVQLMSALTRLQHGDFAALPLADGGAPFRSDANLLHSIRHSTLGQAMQVPDVGTLDIVARLFDQIFSDATISPRLRALISRLQFPLLKVALIDKTFFSDTCHPARCMLDLLSEFNLDSDGDDAAFQNLEDVVNRLLENFADEVEVFAPLVEELRGLLSAHTQEADERAREAASAIERRELRRVAKRRAYEELKRRAAGRALPKVVLKFLMEEWLKLLYLAYINKGDESPAWCNALSTLDQLIWSLEPKTFATERRELAAMLPRLLKQLRAAMRAAGTAAATEQAVLASLMRRHTALIEGKDESNTDPVTTPPQAQQALPTSAESRGAGLAALAAPAEEDVAAARSTELAETAPVETSPPMTTPQQVDEIAIPIAEVQDNDKLIALDFTAAADQRAAIGAGINPAFEIEEVDLAEADSTVEAEATHGEVSAADLRLGDWLEIEQSAGPALAAKLSFITPSGGVYLFTSRGGAEVAQLRFFELARALREGSIRRLEHVSVFDRAVSGLISALRAA
jgi:Protein of unknown function (DUF1631)